MGSLSGDVDGKKERRFSDGETVGIDAGGGDGTGAMLVALGVAKLKTELC